jgi:CHAT domain-containing protein
LKRIIFTLVISFLIVFVYHSDAQNDSINGLFKKFSKFHSKGDLLNAEKCLLKILEFKNTTSEGNIVAVYNNLGVTSTNLGKYEDALDYFNQAERLITNKQLVSQDLADIYINKAYIYNIQKSYRSAIEYFERGIRIYMSLKSNEKQFFRSLSSAYLNFGITYYDIKNYNTALINFNKSANLKSKYNLTGLPLVYVNIAKTFEKTGNSKGAEEYYLKSISTYENQYGKDYFRMAEAYFDYGLFLNAMGRRNESLDRYRKALSICLKNYGEKHTLVSLAFKHIADYYLDQRNCDSSLYYYQKSLIAVVKDFNNTDIFANPSIDSAIFNIRLLDNLKSKAKALEMLAGQQTAQELKCRTVRKSLETIDLAMLLIDRIRNNYQTEESRIWLAENEKETYIFAIDLGLTLYNLTKGKEDVMKMYDIAKKAKAAVLQQEIIENELVYTAGIPDSLRNRNSRLSGNISSYNNLILEELRNKDPDNKKIALWKDALFEMSLEKESLTSRINREYPQYQNLLQETRPVTLSEIQKQLSIDETVVDYLLSTQYKDGKRKMYIFIITRENLEFHQGELDSCFKRNIDIIEKNKHFSRTTLKSGDVFSEETDALFYLYENLIRPVESNLIGNRLIIIPDEEIGQLPFDAFLKSKPRPDQTDFEGLHYLINDYAFSFGYSSSLIFGKEPVVKGSRKVYAFAPAYDGNRQTGNIPDNLYGAVNEINEIFKLYHGRKYTGDEATETNYRTAIKQSAIFHLAMHSLADSSDSRYSYLMFDPLKDSLNDGKLYNYEISISRIKSPMVVLSACNSGTGTLYHGEGLMSLARGFILAGASSVIKTAWEVNDEASAAIITRFYFHLSKGKTKDEALRLAKLEYIKSSPPVYSNPYYWAAYEVLGDNSQVTRKVSFPVFILIILVLIAGTALTVIYFRRRRISADLSV